MSYNNYQANNHYQESGVGGGGGGQHSHQQFYSPSPTPMSHQNMNNHNNHGQPHHHPHHNAAASSHHNPMMMTGNGGGNGYPNHQIPAQGGYHQPYGVGVGGAGGLPFQPNNLFGDPVVSSLAMKYGTNLADQGKEYVSKNVSRFIPISKLKYYFAVDTNYVSKKLSIMLFPFINRDWSIKYSQSDDSSAVPPKLEVNAPDMYIPLMAFVTYLLVVGVSLGMQKKFTPEVLGYYASSALIWFAFEVIVIWISLQVLGIKSALKTFDIIAFCGYKYFGMIVSLLAGVFFSKNSYYIVLLYVCVSFTYFMARSLKMLILSSNNDPTESGQNPYEQHSSLGNKRRVYLLLFISFIQPFFMWLLTYNLAS